MVLAAPLAALGSALLVPAYDALDIGLPQDPIQMAFLFLVALLGTWGVLATTKLWEGRPVSIAMRRFLMLGVGLGLGALSVFLGDWARLAPSPVDAAGSGAVRAAFTGLPGRELDAMLFTAYFGAAFALNGWWKLTARDRAARFRIWPLIKATLVAAFVGLVIPSPQPWAGIIVVLVAIILQLVSPWNREAASIALARRAKMA